MCGISGIWNFDRLPINQKDIVAFNNSLTHRGPDGSGIWRDDQNGMSLGHRRLAIFDLSETGAQPMRDFYGRYVITYNGEIYNFIELRESLIKLGHRFRSDTDTEVVLAAYHEWGEDMLLRFNGMWAFAIWDTQEKKLFLARDRFGIKPLHYHLSAKRFCFASELKSFSSLAGFRPRLDKETAEILMQNAFRVEGTRRTLVSEVHRLQGGHCATVMSNGEIRIRRWWNTLDHLVQPAADLSDQVEEYREIFRDAVSLRMRSDVPIGTCLSGGFDSTAVHCMMKEINNGVKNNIRLSDHWQHAFVATFPGALNDERKEAEKVLRYTGVNGVLLPITNEDATKDIEVILKDFDDVYIGLPTAAWLLYREMRRHGVVVSLDGHGADELMGGYKQADFLYLHDAPSLVRSPLENMRRFIQMHQNLALGGGGNIGLRIKNDLRSILQYHPSFASLRRSTRKLRGYPNNEKSELSDEYSLPWEKDRMPEHWDKINTDFYLMFHATTLPTILRNFDRVSMAHGVEVRMPFMDYRLVCYVMSLPSSSKFGQAQTKYIARESMKGRMPESIRASKIKVGFNSPMPEWLNGPLKNWRKELLSWGVDNEKWIKVATEASGDDVVNWENASRYWTPLNLLWYARALES